MGPGIWKHRPKRKETQKDPSDGKVEAKTREREEQRLPRTSTVKPKLGRERSFELDWNP